jgi:hypothetical protein
MQNKNIPDEHDIALMVELEHELANEYGQLDALTPEQRRGKEVLLRNMKSQFDMPAVAKERLAQQFDPEYKPDPRFDYGISKEERARKDEWRNTKVINWAKLDRGRSNA